MVPYLLATVLEMAEPSCPSVENPMARSDGALARIRRPGGRIDADGLAAVADAADRWGNGIVEITNRANLQLRGIRSGSSTAVAAALTDAGVSAGAVGDLRRNLLLGPLGDLDPDAVDYAPLMGPLLRELDSDHRLDSLSDKFGIAMDGGGEWPLAGRRAAVVVSPVTDGEAALLSCSWGPARTVAKSELPGELAAAAVASLDHRYRSVVVPAAPGKGIPQAGPLGRGPGWVGAMPALGRTDGSTLDRLAGLARRHSGGHLRLTPWRGVVFTQPSDPDHLVAALGRLGLVVDRDDPAASVVACTGTTGCTSGLTDSMGDARRVIEARRERAAPAAGIHISGCGKCCAQRHPAAISLVGSGPGRYDFYRDGRIQASGLDAAAAIEAASRS